MLSVGEEAVWRLRADGSEEQVDLDQVQAEDRVMVHTGEKISVDGAVESGEAAVDQALQRLAITHLAQTPRFDEPAARHALCPQPGPSQDAAWENLIDFSFVEEAGESGWYRLHAHMAATLRKRLARNPDQFTRSHQSWHDYWTTRQSSDVDDHAGLAWYHLWVQQPEDALKLWNKKVEAARNQAQMIIHWDLLDWWTPTNLEILNPENDLDARVLCDVGFELNRATLGNRSVNNKRAIAYYERALRIWTESANPLGWAKTQNSLGNAYADLPTGDRAENLREAIACYDRALRAWTESSYPSYWATTQNNLGTAYADLPTGDRDANLRQAIACYEHALRVWTESAYPLDWAGTQNNLGLAYANLPSGDRATNLREAIACYERALHILTETAYPSEWKMVQDNVSLAKRWLSEVDRDAT